MDFIRESLVSIHGERIATYSGRGGELYDPESDEWITVGKERVKREFATEAGRVKILICTDSASEGLNFQECGALINYDLPWNPMRVEQRNRSHRPYRPAVRRYHHLELQLQGHG